MSATTPPPNRDIARITLSVLGMGLLIGGSLWVLQPFAGAIVWATMIVVATWPLMLRLQAMLGGRRGAAVTVITVVLLLVLFLPLYVAVSAILRQSDRIGELLHEVPTLRVPPPPAWVESLPLVGPRVATRWGTLATLEPQQLAEQLGPHLRTGLAWFAAKAGSFGNTVVQFLLTVVISAILYVKGEAAVRQLRRFFRRLSGQRGSAIVTLSGQAIRAVALGVVVTALIQAVVAAVGLFAVGVPFAGLISAVVLLLCIAQLGPLFAMVPCVIWLYASGSPARGTVLLVITVLAQVIDNVVRPVLIRKGVDLSLLLILPGVVGGLLWLGIIGLFIGPLILAVASTLLDGWIDSGTGENAPEEVSVPTPGADTGATQGGGGGVGLSA